MENIWTILKRNGKEIFSNSSNLKDTILVDEWTEFFWNYDLVVGDWNTIDLILYQINTSSIADEIETFIY